MKNKHSYNIGVPVEGGEVKIVIKASSDEALRTAINAAESRLNGLKIMNGLSN